jgi:hypothetical protein
MVEKKIENCKQEVQAAQILIQKQQSNFLGSYINQDHPWATKISKQYLLHTKLENLLF